MHSERKYCMHAVSTRNHTHIFIHIHTLVRLNHLSHQLHKYSCILRYTHLYFYMCIYILWMEQKLPGVSFNEQVPKKKNLIYFGWKRSSNLYCSWKEKALYLFIAESLKKKKASSLYWWKKKNPAPYKKSPFPCCLS